MSTKSTRSLIVSIFALLACVQIVLGTAIASPPENEKRDVYVPPVLYPHVGTVWTKGQRHNVTWDISNPPNHITNSRGIIILRKGNTATPLVLANDFDILLGRIEVTVPWVVPDTDYSIVLYGDSGNFSPQFTITGPVIF